MREEKPVVSLAKSPPLADENPRLAPLQATRKLIADTLIECYK